MTERKRVHDRISSSTLKVYNNDQRCDRLQCSNLAHYFYGKGYYCGTHARDKSKRVKLPNHSREELQQQKKEQVQQMQKEQEEKRQQGRVGQV